MNTAYVARSLFGAWRLARGDESGMAYFEDTRDGFWRSFQAAAIVAPFYLILISLQFFGAEGIEIDPFRYFTAEALAYVIAWTIFPALMATALPLLGLGRRYIRYIVAYNWAQVLQNALYMPLGFLRVSGLLPPEGAAFLVLIALGLILMYTWFITVSALKVSGGMAAGFVAADFVLSLFVNSLADVVALH